MSQRKTFKLSGVVENTTDCVFPKMRTQPFKLFGTVSSNHDCVHPSKLYSSKVKIVSPNPMPRRK